jgi:hypothetical protein
VRNLTIFTRAGFVSAPFFHEISRFLASYSISDHLNNEFILLEYKKTAHLLGLIIPVLVKLGKQAYIRSRSRLPFNPGWPLRKVDAAERAKYSNSI